MCGIAGFLSRRIGSHAQFQSIAAAMSGTLQHRGPDDEGIWIDPEAGVALVHRRLSIVDLSQAGHQPMVSADGRYVIIYNGEVYSHEDIRPSLLARGCTFRGHSDTEVMLEVDRTVRRRGDPATPDRDVLHCAVGPPRPHAHAGTRPARHQAAVLGEIRRPVPVRFGAQGAARPSGLDAAHRPRRRRGLHAPQLRAGHGIDLRRREQARAGRRSHAAAGRRAAPDALLVRPRGGADGAAVAAARQRHRTHRPA